MNFCRTDLCPDCSTRLNMLPNYSTGTMVDYPLVKEYKSIYYTTIRCEGCRRLWTSQEVLDHWSDYMSLTLDLG